MANGSHFTLLSLKIGKLFIDDRRRRRWNHEIARQVGTRPDCTHGILKDFEDRGWLVGHHERDDGSMGRAARKLYMLTENGAQALRAALLPLQLSSS